MAYLDLPAERPARPRQPRDNARQMWLSEDSFATVLLVLFIDRYGSEALQWHPETIRMQVEADFNVKLPKFAFDKLMAAITIVTTDQFFKDLPKFIDLCNILAGDEFDPTVFNPADSAEIAWAVTEALLLWPPEEDEPFTDEIRGYIGQVLRDEGYVRPPDILKLALDADFADKVKYEFSDDPEMFEAIYANQRGKEDEIVGLIQTNLQELVQQLQVLPLDSGDTSQLLERIQQQLRSK